jgi:tripartite ATP-independent transporter DctM subunit
MTEVRTDAVVMSAFSLDALQAWCSKSTQILASAGVVVMVLTAILTLVDVTMRVIASASLIALNEVVLLTFSVAVSATIPAGLARVGNLKIDVLGRWLTGWLAAWADSVGGFLLLMFYGTLSWRLLLLAFSNATMSRRTMLLELPIWPSILAIAVVLAFGSLVQCVVVLCHVRDALSGRPFDKPEMNRRPNPVFAACFIAAAVLMVILIAWGAIEFDAVSRWMRVHTTQGMIYAFIGMWLLMLAHVPLAALTGAVGIAGGAVYIGVGPALGGFATTSWDFLSNPQVMTLPLFLMMGSFAAVAGLAEDAYVLSNIVLGRMRGGLALATVTGCAMFGAMTGSSVATAATVGRIALPQMRSRGYSAALSTGVCAAGGTVGALVPPSSPLIIYALITNASIAQLFIAAIIPAALAITLYMITVRLYVAWVPAAAPIAPAASAGELRAALRRSSAVGALIFVVLGGLYTGLFTDAESASAGALGAFFIAFCRGKLRGGAIWRVFSDVTATTAMMYGIIFGANILTLFVGLSGTTESSLASFTAYHFAPMTVIIILLGAYLLLGSVLESWTILVLTAPFVTPIVTSMGFDINWWGILMLCVVETGLIHPPFGINVFVLKNIVPDVSVWTIYRGLIPFVATDLVRITLLTAFPVLSLWLLSTMS